MSKNPEQIIFNISGGIGKNIMATAVASSIKDQYPDSKIIVTTPWVEVWKNNPHVEHVTNIVNDVEFYKNHVHGKDSLFFSNDPYLREDFFYKRKHLIEIWCDIYGVKYNGSQPKLYFTEDEEKAVKDKLPKDKKLFMIQTLGGASVQEYPISWMRDMPLPFAQKVVDHMNDKGYRTVHLRREDQYGLENSDWIPMSIRELLCATKFADKALYIDSVAQHAATANGKQSVVTWIGNRPNVYGYESDVNILPNKPLEFRHNIGAYLDEWNIAGVLEECPYDTNDIFDFDEVIKALE